MEGRRGLGVGIDDVIVGHVDGRTLDDAEDGGEAVVQVRRWQAPRGLDVPAAAVVHPEPGARGGWLGGMAPVAAAAPSGVVYDEALAAKAVTAALADAAGKDALGETASARRLRFLDETLAQADALATQMVRTVPCLAGRRFAQSLDDIRTLCMRGLAECQTAMLETFDDRLAKLHESIAPIHQQTKRLTTASNSTAISRVLVVSCHILTHLTPRWLADSIGGRSRSRP